MNRIVIVLLLLASSVTFTTAQENDATAGSPFPKAVFGIKAGVNFSRFSASVNSEPQGKAGLALGLYLRKQMGHTSFFRPEIYYSNQGQKDNYVMPSGGSSMGSTTTTMHYLNVPFLFEFGRKVTFQVGPQVGVMISGKEKGTIAGEDVDEKLNDVMTALDLAVVVGVGYPFSEHVNAGFRINYGVSNIYTPDQLIGLNIDYPDVHNRVMHFYLGYSF